MELEAFGLLAKSKIQIKQEGRGVGLVTKLSR